MEKEYFIIPMGRNTKVNGMKIYVKVMEHIHIQIMIHMQVNGKIIKDTEKERIHMQLQVCINSLDFILRKKEFL